jgi:excisionase family DNA binding protein
MTVLTAEQTASYLQLHVVTVRRYLNEGLIPAQKFGNTWRISQSAIDRFLEGETWGSNEDQTVSGHSVSGSLTRRPDVDAEYESLLGLGTTSKPKNGTQNDSMSSGENSNSESALRIVGEKQ